MSIESKTPSHLHAAKAVGSVSWYFLIRGLFILVAGIYVLFRPEHSAMFFVQLVGALVLIDGVLTAVAGLTGRAASRLWTFVRGGLFIVLGLLGLLNPDLVASLAMKTRAPTS